MTPKYTAASLDRGWLWNAAQGARGTSRWTGPCGSDLRASSPGHTGSPPCSASMSAPLVLQRQLWRCLSAGSVVSAAGLGLASSPPPGPVGGGVEVGSRGADEGVEQPSQLGHGQRDELAGSGCGPPFSAVARVADR